MRSGPVADASAVREARTAASRGRRLLALREGGVGRSERSRRFHPAVALNVFLLTYMLLRWLFLSEDAESYAPSQVVHRTGGKVVQVPNTKLILSSNSFLETTGTALEEAYAALSVVAQQQRKFPNGGQAAPCRSPPTALPSGPIDADGTGDPSGAAGATGTGADAQAPRTAAGAAAIADGAEGTRSVGGRPRGAGLAPVSAGGGLGDGGGADQKWLVVGIPTFPRPGNPDYLGVTLEALLAELPMPLPGGGQQPFGPEQVAIIVMNNAPGAHVAFDNARRRFSSSPPGGIGGGGGGGGDGGGDGGRAAADRRKGSAYIRFVDNPGTFADPTPDAPPVDDLHNPKNRPGAEVRKQTCDLVTILEAAAPAEAPLGELYLFMEDDFAACGHMVRTVQYAVQKARARFPSYGMNGVLMRSADVPAFSQYLRSHVTRLPPDLLWQEWSSRLMRGSDGKPRRPLLVYRHNMLAHIGGVSSFAVRPRRPKWPGCYHSMSDIWSLLRTERFDAARCGHSDLSPCEGAVAMGPGALGGKGGKKPRDALADALRFAEEAGAPGGAAG